VLNSESTGGLSFNFQVASRNKVMFCMCFLILPGTRDADRRRA
jgi:hypothetical protein